MYLYAIDFDDIIVPFLTRIPHKSRQFNVIGNCLDNVYDFMTKELDGDIDQPIECSVKTIDRIKDGVKIGKKFAIDRDPETKDLAMILDATSPYTDMNIKNYPKGSPCIHNKQMMPYLEYTYNWNSGEFYCKHCGTRLLSPTNPYYDKITGTIHGNRPFHLKEGKLTNQMCTCELIRDDTKLHNEVVRMFSGDYVCYVFKKGDKMYSLRYSGFEDKTNIFEISYDDSGVHMKKIGDTDQFEIIVK
jgi:hypothetical protein